MNAKTKKYHNLSTYQIIEGDIGLIDDPSNPGEQIFDVATAQNRINELANFIQTRYGYDIGGFESNNRFLESDKITAKLDWNIDDRNKISLSTRYVKAENLEARTSSGSTLGFLNGSEFFNSKTLSGSLEWNYQGRKNC